jgi:hypothetical protein
LDALSGNWQRLGPVVGLNQKALSAQIAFDMTKRYLGLIRNPFRHFDSSPEVIQFIVQMYVRYPLSLRNAGDPLPRHGIDICREAVRLW